ncbi:hypothetical protein [Pseudorhodoferax sp. Leaf274]|uniref:hypothetical protein n=1 Tax=Pseudorhodoferax sp. Leaf274 TaxID=1736318 RepID=UPI00070242F5|nr:hypothetical protein [Pseudorhodoferax sp. Leaf274]KQP37555.1 hypothetical protein ASF44_14510 [Pseudorhodoferax sp. Leaf274]
MVWAEYRARFGTLNLGHRLEFLFGRSDWVRHASHGGKEPLDKFLRYYDEPPQEKPAEASAASLEMIARMFGAPVEVRR